MGPEQIVESFALLAFAGAVLADLRLLRRAYENQAERVAIIEGRQREILALPDSSRSRRAVTES